MKNIKIIVTVYEDDARYFINQDEDGFDTGREFRLPAAKYLAQDNNPDVDGIRISEDDSLEFILVHGYLGNRLAPKLEEELQQLFPKGKFTSIYSDEDNAGRGEIMRMLIPMIEDGDVLIGDVTYGFKSTAYEVLNMLHHVKHFKNNIYIHRVFDSVDDMTSSFYLSEIIPRAKNEDEIFALIQDDDEE